MTRFAGGDGGEGRENKGQGKSTLMLAEQEQGPGLFLCLHLSSEERCLLSDWPGEWWMSAQILYIKMLHDQGQRGQWGKEAEVQPECRPGQKGEFQARSLKNQKSRSRTKIARNQGGKVRWRSSIWWTGRVQPQQEQSRLLTLGSVSHFSSRVSPVLRERLGAQLQRRPQTILRRQRH